MVMNAARTQNSTVAAQPSLRSRPISASPSSDPSGAMVEQRILCHLTRRLRILEEPEEFLDHESHDGEDQPQLRRLLRQVRGGRIRVVIVADASRLPAARRAQLARHGATVIGANPHSWTFPVQRGNSAHDRNRHRLGPERLMSRIAPPEEQTARHTRAVLYLRVSTTSQVNTDYDPEGISIPAQRGRLPAQGRASSA